MRSRASWSGAGGRVEVGSGSVIRSGIDFLEGLGQFGVEGEIGIEPLAVPAGPEVGHAERVRVARGALDERVGAGRGGVGREDARLDAVDDGLQGVPDLVEQLAGDTQRFALELPLA